MSSKPVIKTPQTEPKRAAAIGSGVAILAGNLFEEIRENSSVGKSGVVFTIYPDIINPKIKPVREAKDSNTNERTDCKEVCKSDCHI